MVVCCVFGGAWLCLGIDLVDGGIRALEERREKDRERERLGAGLTWAALLKRPWLVP